MGDIALGRNGTEGEDIEPVDSGEVAEVENHVAGAGGEVVVDVIDDKADMIGTAGALGEDVVVVEDRVVVVGVGGIVDDVETIKAGSPVLAESPGGTVGLVDKIACLVCYCNGVTLVHVRV